MSDCIVVAKGKYTDDDNIGAVTVDSYVMLADGTERYLMLKFFNGRQDSIDGITFKLSQYKADGSVIASDTSSVGGFSAAGKSSFVPADRYLLDPECADFKVAVLSVSYGNYTYIKGKDAFYADYLLHDGAKKFSAKSIRRSMHGKDRVVADVRSKFSIMILAFALLLAAVLAVCGYFTVRSFTSTANGFTADGIEYSFEEDGTVAVSGYAGGNKNVVIPAEVDSYTVTRVLDSAFEQNKGLRSITFAANVSIGTYAFSGCTGLREVHFGDNITIGTRAFAGCSSLQEVDLSGVLSVGEYAFADCTSMKEVSAGESKAVLTMGAYVFSGCTSLVSAVFDRYVDFSTDGPLFSDCRSFELLDIVSFNIDRNGAINRDRLLSSLFANNASAAEIHIDTVGVICDRFAAGLVGLKRFSVDNVVESGVGNYAFADDVSLEEVSLPAYIATIGEYAFSGTALREFDMSYVQSIGIAAFKNCFSLTYVSFGFDSIFDSIPSECFSGCSQLTEIVIPPSVLSIGTRAFAECVSLASVRMTNVESIGEYAFDACSGLTRIELPTTLRTISAFAFRNCGSLQELTVPENLSSVGASAFVGCYDLIVIRNLSRNNIVVGGTSFGNIAHYAAVVLKDKTTRVVSYVANGVRYYQNDDGWVAGELVDDLSVLYLDPFTYGSESVQTYTVRNGAFYGEQSLETVYINAPTSVGASAFLNCTNLQTVMAGADVRIGFNALGGVPGIVYYGGTKTVWNQYCPNTGILNGQVLFYAECVHEEGQWTYVDGKADTTIAPEEWIVDREPTCEQTGMGHYVCTKCGETLRYEEIDKIPHTPDEDGRLKRIHASV